MTAKPRKFIKFEPQTANSISKRKQAKGKAGSKGKAARVVPIVPRAIEEYDPEIQEMITRFHSRKNESSIEADETKEEHDEEEHDMTTSTTEKAAAGNAVPNPPTTLRQKRKTDPWTVGRLKLAVYRPEAVDLHDINANDPIAAVHLRTYRNYVPVPQHWSHRRKYLSQRSSNLRYELPADVAGTRVATIRKYYVDKARASQHHGTAASKGSNALVAPRPDYDALRDCFTKVSSGVCAELGVLYTEGERRAPGHRDVQPGFLSSRLRVALGMPAGVSTPYPPPWLVHMQVHGPPPGYPSLLLPGVNAPLPPGTSWGHDRGQWGRPPTDAIHPKGKWGDVLTAGPRQAEMALAEWRWGARGKEEVGTGEGARAGGGRRGMPETQCVVVSDASKGIPAGEGGVRKADAVRVPSHLPAPMPTPWSPSVSAQHMAGWDPGRAVSHATTSLPQPLRVPTEEKSQVGTIPASSQVGTSSGPVKKTAALPGRSKVDSLKKASTSMQF